MTNDNGFANAPTPVTMTFQEYDSMKSEVGQFKLTDEDCWPTSERLEQVYKTLNDKDKARFLIYLDWLLENNGEPTTLSQKYSRQAIKDFLHKYLVLT